MDIITIIEIVAAIVAIYLFIKFIVSPVIRVVLGVIIFIIIVNLSQHAFGFDLNKIFGPFAKYLDLNKLGINLNWILSPINNCIDQIKIFWSSILQNITKSFNQ